MPSPGLTLQFKDVLPTELQLPDNSNRYKRKALTHRGGQSPASIGLRASLYGDVAECAPYQVVQLDAPSFSERNNPDRLFSLDSGGSK